MKAKILLRILLFSLLMQSCLGVANRNSFVSEDKLDEDEIEDFEDSPFKPRLIEALDETLDYLSSLGYYDLSEELINIDFLSDKKDMLRIHSSPFFYKNYARGYSYHNGFVLFIMAGMMAWQVS